MKNASGAPVGSQKKGKKVEAKKQVPPNYDYTGKERVDRTRKALTAAGGARVEAFLEADELAKLDALMKTLDADEATKGFASRRGALKYLVQQLPAPGKKNSA